MGRRQVGEKAKGEARSEQPERVTGTEGIPADVAALYRWLDVQDLEYQEFSAERRQRRVSAMTEPRGDTGERLAAGAGRREGARAEATVTEVGGADRSVEPGRMLPKRLPPGEGVRFRWRIPDGPMPGPARTCRVGDTVPERTAVPRAGGMEEADQRERCSAVEAYAQAKPYAAAADREGVVQPVPKDSNMERKTAAKGNEAGAGELPSWIGRYARTYRGERKEVSGESLKKTRERIAGRWFGLRGVLQARLPKSAGAPEAEKDVLPPILAVFSVAGGTGKTSLAASLTRALAAQGERVLLLGMSRSEALPFYFGAGEARPGQPRVFAPPPGVADAPVHLLSYPGSSPDATEATAEGEGGGLQAFAERLKRDSKGFSRVVVDLQTGDAEALRELLALGGCVLVPMPPDMNSVLTMAELRRVAGERGSGGAGQMWHVLTRFDAAQPLHLDIREVLEQELGEQLLPMAVRSSPAVAEALAQGLTVIDYAPAEGVSQDLLQLAAWVRTLREPAREGLGQVRWSEQP